MMGSWIVAPADFNVIFNVPDSEKWKAAAALIGIELRRYCDSAAAHRLLII